MSYNCTRLWACFCLVCSKHAPHVGVYLSHLYQLILTECLWNTKKKILTELCQQVNRSKSTAAVIFKQTVLFTTFFCLCVPPPPQCPDSTCKNDLLAYLQRIALYCHQLNICSKVKAEVQNLGGELVVSGVS